MDATVFTPAKPLLLLDVDGILNPWRKVTRKGHRAGDDYHRHDLTDVPGHPNGLAVLLSPAHGKALRDLTGSYTLVWATTWMHEANRLLSPRLGLPTDIPVIEWPHHLLDRHPREGRNGSWKTPWIARWLDGYARGLPWAWVDDELNRFDRKWFDGWYENHPDVPRLLLRVDGNHALNDTHIAALHEFAATVRPTTGPTSRTTPGP